MPSGFRHRVGLELIYHYDTIIGCAVEDRQEAARRPGAPTSATRKVNAHRRRPISAPEKQSTVRTLDALTGVVQSMREVQHNALYATGSCPPGWSRCPTKKPRRPVRRRRGALPAKRASAVRRTQILSHYPFPRYARP